MDREEFLFGNFSAYHDIARKYAKFPNINPLIPYSLLPIPLLAYCGNCYAP